MMNNPFVDEILIKNLCTSFGLTREEAKVILGDSKLRRLSERFLRSNKESDLVVEASGVSVRELEKVLKFYKLSGSHDQFLA